MLTRSPLDVRLGDPTPQILHLPPDVHSLDAAIEAIELANSYGVCNGFPLAESQEITLRAALGERGDGSWAATRIGDFGPRQGTGKNDKINARELAGLLLYGERLIIHTAHEFPTANEAFLRMVAIWENFDDLRRRVARIRYANGEQGIELLSGQRLKYRARTGGSGRGFAAADLVVYDEAQHLQAEHVAASGPSRLSNPNSQAWYAGSGGLETSTVAWAMRRQALSGAGGRLAYTEKTGEQIALVDGKVASNPPEPSDRDVWYAAMPGLGRWVTEESMEALFSELGPDLFARECLCVWDLEPGAATESVIPAEEWKACEDPDSAPEGGPVFAVDVTPDRSWASIAAAGYRPDGLPHVEIIEHKSRTGWVVDRLGELNRKWNPRRIVADPASPAGSLFADCEAAGVPLEPLTAREHAQACGLIFDLVTEKRMRHRPEPLLDAALAGASRRNTGDAWLWSRRNSLVDISPLVAATLALGSLPAPVVAAAGFKNLDDFLE